MGEQRAALKVRAGWPSSMWRRHVGGGGEGDRQGGALARRAVGTSRERQVPTPAEPLTRAASGTEDARGSAPGPRDAHRRRSVALRPSAMPEGRSATDRGISVRRSRPGVRRGGCDAGCPRRHRRPMTLGSDDRHRMERMPTAPSRSAAPRAGSRCCSCARSTLRISRRSSAHRSRDASRPNAKSRRAPGAHGGRRARASVQRMRRSAGPGATRMPGAPPGHDAAPAPPRAPRRPRHPGSRSRDAPGSTRRASATPRRAPGWQAPR